MAAKGSGTVGTEAYFLARVRVTGKECLEWTSTLNEDGYGRAVVAYKGPGKPVRRVAHLAFYELKVGVVPAKLDLDHLCRNRKCINPLHLEPVTRRENVVRGILPQMMKDKAARQTHCKFGHALSGENLILQGPSKTARACRTCAKARKRLAYASKKGTVT